MNDFKFSVVIPSYNPDEKLAEVVSSLQELGVGDIIVVNDGSKKECLKYFEKVRSLGSVTYLEHRVNRGKGAALKTAFKYILNNRPDSIGCVTADGDAQHLPEDIVKCGLMLSDEHNGIILGVRDFSLPEVPPRSRIGNRITSAVFRIFVGMKLSDTQTGLRAVPVKYLEAMSGVAGDRYEYETNMLLNIKKQHIPYTEKIIQTVYIEENKTSHFNPIKDSWRIYKLILSHFFKYSLSSLFCLVLEQIIQSTVYAFSVGNLLSYAAEIIAFLPARIISSVVNYTINRKYVFSQGSPGIQSLIRYYILWFCQAITTMLLDWFFSSVVFKTSSLVLYTVITLVIKTAIAIVSFRIQKDWVFDEAEQGAERKN